MTAYVPARVAAGEPSLDGAFDLVESSAGWQLTITLTDRLREALDRGADDQQLRFGVRITPNLVPGEPFQARLCIKDPDDPPTDAAS